MEFGNFLPRVGRLRSAFRLIYERAGRVFAADLPVNFLLGDSIESEKANKLRRHEQ